MNRGDLAIIVGGPWPEAVGKVVRLVYRCKKHGSMVIANQQVFWMTADGPAWMVSPVTGVTLPAGLFSGKETMRFKRRPYCEAHLRPLLQKETALAVTQEAAAGYTELAQLQRVASELFTAEAGHYDN